MGGCLSHPQLLGVDAPAGGASGSAGAPSGHTYRRPAFYPGRHGSGASSKRGGAARQGRGEPPLPLLLTPHQVLALAHQVLAAPLKPGAHIAAAVGAASGGGGSSSGGTQSPGSAAGRQQPLPGQEACWQPSAVTLAALALCDSAGRPDLVQHSPDCEADRLGLCQVLLSTATWLATVHGYTRHGTSPAPALLLDPAACLYYAAGYLQLLQGHEGRPRREDWLLRAWHAGPKGVSTPSARAYGARARKASLLLCQLEAALEARQAAARAVAAGEACPEACCTMHVAAQGETVEGVAAACGLWAADVLAANPDLAAAGGQLQAGDCIALPVASVLPRLVALQPADTLASLCEVHGVPLGRLLVCNPELRDPDNVCPGWVVALPGLAGDSQPPDGWLEALEGLRRAQLRMARRQQQAHVAAGAAAAAASAGADNWASVAWASVSTSAGPAPSAPPRGDPGGGGSGGAAAGRALSEGSSDAVVARVRMAAAARGAGGPDAGRRPDQQLRQPAAAKAASGQAAQPPGGSASSSRHPPRGLPQPAPPRDARVHGHRRHGHGDVKGGTQPQRQLSAPASALLPAWQSYEWRLEDLEVAGGGEEGGSQDGV